MNKYSQRLLALLDENIKDNFTQFEKQLLDQVDDISVVLLDISAGHFEASEDMSLFAQVFSLSLLRDAQTLEGQKTRDDLFLKICETVTSVAALNCLNEKLMLGLGVFETVLFFICFSQRKQKISKMEGILYHAEEKLPEKISCIIRVNDKHTEKLIATEMLQDDMALQKEQFKFLVSNPPISNTEGFGTLEKFHLYSFLPLMNHVFNWDHSILFELVKKNPGLFLFFPDEHKKETNLSAAYVVGYYKLSEDETNLLLGVLPEPSGYFSASRKKQINEQLSTTEPTIKI